ncbi:MAG: hypothetical protein ACP5N3_04355 [Candidatus Nanoarchaeia archaeon]
MKAREAVLLGLLAYSCSTKTPEIEVDRSCDSSSVKITSEVMSKEDSIKEQFLQNGFYEVYVVGWDSILGTRLYTNKELFSDLFQNSDLFPVSLKVRHYFLRNGKEATLEAAEKLGAKHRTALMTKNYSLTNLFNKAGINIEGEVLDLLEIPKGRSGCMEREKKYFLGEDERLMSVEAFTDEPDNFILEPARAAGYTIDRNAEFRGVVANELSHEIQGKYFNELFSVERWEEISEPFASFKSEVPGLKFYNNAQAGEFLSDVATWKECQDTGVLDRFFNPLFYMSPNAFFNMGPEGRYAYTFKVQRYAMEQVLKNKGYKNPKSIVNNIIEFAAKTDCTNHDSLFILTRKYFQEDDFKEIAKIYERIGVDLLRTMKPYFKKD